MAIFKKKRITAAAPPEEEESPEELEEIEEDEDEDEDEDEEEEIRQVKKAVTKQKAIPQKKPEVEIREVPICLSQAQVNNLVIECHIMLKQIISEMNS